MLSGNINQLQLIPYMNPVMLQILKRAIAYMESNREPKIHRFDDTDDFFINIMKATTQDKSLRLAEIHHKYIDIQLILEGMEVIGYGYHPEINIEDNQLKEKDLALFSKIKEEKEVLLFKDDFVVFFPTEAHRPLCRVADTDQEVYKAVIKIKASSLGL